MADPVGLAGCRAWYTFDNPNTIYTDTNGSTFVSADGQTVSYVDDQSGNNADMTQYTVASKPTWKTNIINGRAVLRFDGVADYLEAVVVARTAFTMFIVAKKRTVPTTATQELVDFDSARAFLHTNSSVGSGFLWDDNNALATVPLGGTPTTANIICIRVAAAASMGVFVAGTETAFDPHNNVTTSTAFSLGGTSALSNLGDYDIGEVLYYDSALFFPDVDIVANYLQGKWAAAWTPISSAPHSDWSASASATTLSSTNTVTVASVLKPIRANATISTGRATTGFSEFASATTQSVVNTATAASVLPSLDASVTVGPGPGFTPTDIAGCKSWYDFSDRTRMYSDSSGSTLVTTDGQPIGYVDDYSGGNRDLQQLTVAAQPTYKTNIISGKSVARFDGVNDYFSVVMGADTSWTLFMVAKKRSAVGASQTVFAIHDAAALYTASAGSGAGFLWWTTQIGTEVDAGGVPTDSTILSLTVTSASSMTIRTDNGIGTTFDPNDTVTSASTMVFGANSSLAQFADYDIGEIIGYDTALSVGNRTQVYNYLAGKWLSNRTGFSASASATTLSGAITATASNTLPKLTTAVTASTTPPPAEAALQGDTFQNDAFQVIAGPGAGAMASTLSALTQAATATTAMGGPIASTLLPVTAVLTATVSGAINQITVSNTLPKLTQATSATMGPNTAVIASVLPPVTTSALAGFPPPTATVSNTLPKLTTAASASTGQLRFGPVASTLPEPTTAATVFTGATLPGVATITSTLPSLTQNVLGQVDSPPVPPTPVGATGLVHIFKKGASSRLLPATNSPLQVVGGFQDRASMVGGFMSATGEISEDEYNAHPNEYSVGTTWLVKSVDLEAAGQPPYIFAGELKQAEEAEGKVKLAADGWGLLQDRQVERFLLASAAVDQWVPGDTRPHNFPGTGRIAAEVKTHNLVFEIKRNAHFRKNDAGQPDKWRSHPMVFWAPKTDLRWIRLTITASGRHTGVYDLELVGTPTGPTGNLTVLRTWNITNTTVDEEKEHFIPAGYDLIGLRVVRQTQAKEAPHVRVVVSDVMVGGYAQDETYSIRQAFITLFGVMGTNTTQVATSSLNVLPYDAARASLADIADDLGVLGQWYWRIWANAAGAKQGEAGPAGATNWSVSLVHTPVRPLPAPRYNVVQYDYKYGGGYVSQETVRANPDPYPGTDIVYVLDLGDPPIQVLAQQLAQQVANIVSKPWMSGSGTLHKVDPGNLPATIVKPGDKLTLTNYDNAEVLVDEITHSEDGALVEVQFADSSKLIDRWLARWQQKINQGLSPNAAALELLHVNRPKPPNVSAAFTMSQKKEGRKDFDLVAIASLVTEDIEGEGTFVKRYEFRARPIDPQSGNAIPDAQGGGWRGRAMRAPGDDEAEETKSVVWDKIQNPHKWAWQVQGWAVDALGQKSTRDEEFPGKPAAFQPVTPQSVSLDVDQRVMTVSHVIPADPDDPTEEDQTYDHAIIRINDHNGDWNNPLRQDRKVKGETKRFRFHKPVQGTYYAQVTYVDFWGNKSNPVVVSNSKKIPPLPLIGTPDFDANGSRHARYRVRVPVTVNDTGHDDEVRRIIVQLSHKPTNVQPVLADKKVRDQVRVGDDPQEALFRNLPKTHYVFVRAMCVDSDQKDSGWSSWVAMGRPKDSGVTTTPPQPASTGFPVGQVKVTTPTPRRVVADWDEPDDDEATRWRVVFKRGATTVDTIRTRNTRAVYRVPKADVGQNHTADVYAINDTGGESTPASGSGTPDDDPGGAAASNPPNQPAAPTLAFDAQGTRHAKYRAIVTAGVANTDATHDAAQRYVIQLAHSATGGPGGNPPAGTKRQHGNVEGDAAGDDLDEVFRNIPKNHFVWVRERARNAAGASTWTGWQGGTKPSGAITPPVPGTVTATAPTPRRVKAIWPDPNDDETVRWRVDVKKGANVVESGNTRSNRYIYHVPQGDVGASHTVLVFAISDTATESAASTSNAVVPDPDPTGGVGNPPNVPSNPSFTADGQGTRHAKYRIIVTAGTSTTDAGHDAPHRYVLQLVHSATDTGANPPTTGKRQTGSVEGDGAGEELQEVFRNIPKRHYVWVRQRARNAAGASAWTGWRTSSRPIDFGVAVAPAAPTGVTVTTPAPRRVKVTWDDPDTVGGGDDDVTRWRVQIFRSGNLVETGYSRSTRYIYHVPAAHVGQNHNARVYAVSDTGTDSSQLSNDGAPTGDPSGALVGSIRWHAGPGVPAGYLHCDGTPFSSTTFPALYGAIGTTYGGTISNPLLPDIKNRKVKAKGNLGNIGDNEGNAEGGRDDKHQHKNHNHDNHKHDQHRHNNHAHGNHGHFGDELDQHVGAVADEAGGHEHGAGSLGTTGGGFSYQLSNRGAGGTAVGGTHEHSINGTAGPKNSAHYHDSQGNGRYIEGAQRQFSGYHRKHAANSEERNDNKGDENERDNDPKGNQAQFNDDEKRSPHIVLWAIIRTDDI